MSDPASASNTSDLPQSTPASTLAALDSTRGSILHTIFCHGHKPSPSSRLPLGAVYLAAVALTYLPLLIAAQFSPYSLTTITPSNWLPFLCDWNVLFMFLVSFPSLVVFAVNDQHVLSSSLASVEKCGTLEIDREIATTISTRWQKRFYTINHASLIIGVLAGLAVSYVNYTTYTPASVGYWIAMDCKLLPVGYIYLYCIFAFYFVVSIFTLRSIAIAWLLRDIVSNARLHMLPMHPDKSGGLRPVGRLGLRNQYLLTLLGINIVILVAVSYYYLFVPDSLYGLIVAAIVAYLILGPLVFLGPLLSFRTGMLKAKTELLEEVASRLRIELQRLRAKLQNDQISQQDEELIDRLRKIGSVIDDLPIWPFDSSTLKKFLVAYVIPGISSLAYAFSESALEFIKQFLK